MWNAGLRGLLLVAAVCAWMPGVANAAMMAPMSIHRQAVDERSYPWSSIGKLFNETGDSCSGVVISRDHILTAAHCLYNYRTSRFVPADALHFLVGYRTGRYSFHARIASYQIGAGFDPLRYDATSGADWAVLTVIEALPDSIEPLRLRPDGAPSGTKAFIAGYAQDRAFAMTADQDCELGEKSGAGRYLLHTCHNTKGYSGAPILVRSGNEIQIAGLQIATMRGVGAIALPAQEIWRHGRDKPAPAVEAAVEPPAVCVEEAAVTLDAIHVRLAFENTPDETDIVSSIPAPLARSSAMEWLALEPFAFAIP